MRFLTRTVWILSLVSLFTDMASEMLYPIMPVYLKSIGFSVILIGVLEGIAEGVSGLSKGCFGQLSDNTGKRSPFVQLGYSMSAISKPMMILFRFPLWIFFARTLDRLGKGIRTGARDAILSSETNPENKGKVFGFHRAMDTLGAVLGPSIALIYLSYKPGNYHALFYIAFLPGVLAVVSTLLIRDRKKNTVRKARVKTSFLSFLKYWKESPTQYRQVVVGILVFTLFNSSDMFLLLKVKQAGLSDISLIWIYIFYNCIYAFSSYPLGAMGDKIGLKKTYILGLFLFATAYMGIAFSESLYAFLAFFFVYGLFAAATDGISKAWISNLVPKENTATAIGTLASFQSICTMLASALAGLLWFGFGPILTFAISGGVSLLVAIYFSLNKIRQSS